MQERNGPNWNNFEIDGASQPWWSQLLRALNGCEFAMIAVLGFSSLHPPQEHWQWVAILAALVGLGIGGAVIRKRR